MTPIHAGHPLVSVVIPTFNSARWVDQTLVSVLAQDYPSVEIIVADNGSADDTLDVVRTVAPSATVVLAPRLPGTLSRGAAIARNAGLDAARGAYVQFLDSDDLLGAEKISRHVAVLEATSADVVFGGFQEIGPDSAPGRLAPRRRHDPAIDVRDVPRSVIGPGGFLQLGAALFRRSGPVAGVRFDASPGTIEDVRYVIDVGFSGARFVQAPDAELYWRHHDSPIRVSRRDDVEFYMACVRQADYVLARWQDLGPPLTPERIDTIVGVWLMAAEVLEAKASPALDDVLARLKALDRSWYHRIRRPHRLLIPALGYRRTFRLARALKQVVRGPVSTESRRTAAP